MKHWQWVFLALTPLLVTAVLVVVPRTSGGVDPVEAQGAVLALDMDTTDGPCTDIDDDVQHGQGDQYTVGICIAGLTQQTLGQITIDVLYNDQLNQAAEVSCPTGNCLDDNPDANAGSSTWGTGLSLGAWDCNILDIAEPRGDRDGATGPGNGDAFLSCWTLTSPYTPGYVGATGVLGVVEFTAEFEGVDTLSLSGSSVSDLEGNPLIDCAVVTCPGGLDTKSGSPVPTATFTAQPTATITPIEGTFTPTRRPWTLTPTPEPTGTPEAPTSEPPPAEQTSPPPPPPPSGGAGPAIVPPSTGTGGDGTPWTQMALFSLAGIGVFSVAIGGFCLRRVRS